MQTSEVARDRLRDRETRPGGWVEAARTEAGRRTAKAKGEPGDKIKAVSQMKLATLVGRHVSAVARWESNEGEVDYVVWLGVLHALGIEADWEPGKPAPGEVRPSRAKPKPS